MSENYGHSEVAIRCRVRIASIANLDYGEDREMTCVMVHYEYLQNNHNGNPDETNRLTTSNNETPCVNNCYTSDNNQKNSATFPLKINEVTPSEENIGPKLMFKPIPRPPSRPLTQTVCTNEELKLHSPVDKVPSIPSLPVYNGIPGKVYPRPQSPDPLDTQTSNRLRRGQPPAPPSVRAAAMFAVKKGTVTDLVDDNETYAIPMSQVAVVYLKPSSVDDILNDTNLINITTVHGGVLQISFYHHHEQDLLLGFLQAFLLPSVLNIETGVEHSLGRNLDRSVSSMDMDIFEAREVKCRFLNESLWDKLKRRTTHWLSRTEEICLGCDDNDRYVCAIRPENVDDNELEIDDGLGLHNDLSNIEEDAHDESGSSAQISSTIDSQIVTSRMSNRKGECSPNMSQKVETNIIDDRDDAAQLEWHTP